MWSLDGGIIVKRKSNPKEATVEAHGLLERANILSTPTEEC
jgi:hypothetical protein